VGYPYYGSSGHENVTPESKTKRLISAALRRHGDQVFYHMPVPSGYGGPALDYLGVCRGAAFAIEAKALGMKPTLRQQGTIAALERAGARVFVIDGPEGVMELEHWLMSPIKTVVNF
jgi:hypothetical protein